jgi:hypothetical protein
LMANRWKCELPVTIPLSLGLRQVSPSGPTRLAGP